MIGLPDWALNEAGQVARRSAYDPADPTLRDTLIWPAAFDGVERHGPAPLVA